MAKIKNTMTVSLEEFGKKAGEYALDEFEYKGLTIRQWADKITSGEYQKVTWYTAAENQPDSVGDDVLIVDHDGKYHVAYYCSKGNWIDTNTGNPIDVIKWRYLDGDSE